MEMESILTSIKKMLGITAAYDHYDADIIMHINDAFSVLNQLGVGPANGFFIEDDSAVWSDFTEDVNKIHTVKTYIFRKVKIVFDPASLGSATLAAYERQIQEQEWRLNVTAESDENTENE